MYKPPNYMYKPNKNYLSHVEKNLTVSCIPIGTIHNDKYIIVAYWPAMSEGYFTGAYFTSSNTSSEHIYKLIIDVKERAKSHMMRGLERKMIPDFKRELGL